MSKMWRIISIFLNFLLVLILASNYVIWVENVEPFFQDLSLFVHQNPSTIISENDFKQAGSYVTEYPIATLEVISKIADPKLIYSLAFAWEKGNYGYYKKSILWEKSKPECKITLIFNFFNNLMRYLVFYHSYSKVKEISDHRKIIKSVASILEKVGHSYLELQFKLYDMHRFSFTTGGYVKFLNNLYKILLEPDSVKGLQKAFYRLKLLSQNYNGIIPEEITEKPNLLSLVIACNYYSCSINRDNFRLLDIKATEPKMLALLIHHSFFLEYYLGDIFSKCTSGKIIDEAIKRLNIHFWEDLKAYGYKNCLYPENLLPSISKKLGERDLALFKIYVKLLVYSRSVSESQVSNQILN